MIGTDGKIIDIDLRSDRETQQARTDSDMYMICVLLTKYITEI